MPTTTIADGLPAPMLAAIQEQTPEGEGWTYEPKWDGFRTIVAVDRGEVTLASRTGRPLGRYFPEIVTLVGERSGSGRFVLDGEIVMMRPGAMDFGLLQLRLHPAASRVAKLAAEFPTTLVLFDLLREGDEDLMGSPLAERRERLAALASRLDAAEAPTELARTRRAPRSRSHRGPTTSRWPVGGSPTRPGSGKTGSSRNARTSRTSRASGAGSR